jgi:hypothetical protein
MHCEKYHELRLISCPEMCYTPLSPLMGEAV